MCKTCQEVFMGGSGSRFLSKLLFIFRLFWSTDNIFRLKYFMLSILKQFHATNIFLTIAVIWSWVFWTLTFLNHDEQLLTGIIPLTLPLFPQSQLLFIPVPYSWLWHHIYIPLHVKLMSIWVSAVSQRIKLFFETQLWQVISVGTSKSEWPHSFWHRWVCIVLM